jgi:hypothetical protein
MADVVRKGIDATLYGSYALGRWRIETEKIRLGL